MVQSKAVLTQPCQKEFGFICLDNAGTMGDPERIDTVGGNPRKLAISSAIPLRSRYRGVDIECVDELSYIVRLGNAAGLD